MSFNHNKYSVIYMRAYLKGTHSENSVHSRVNEILEKLREIGGTKTVVTRLVRYTLLPNKYVVDFLVEHSWSDAQELESKIADLAIANSLFVYTSDYEFTFHRDSTEEVKFIEKFPFTINGN